MQILDEQLSFEDILEDDDSPELPASPVVIRFGSDIIESSSLTGKSVEPPGELKKKHMWKHLY